MNMYGRKHSNLVALVQLLTKYHSSSLLGTVKGSFATFAKNSSKPSGGGVRCSRPARQAGESGAQPNLWKT